jgi:hypothetical protein
MPLAPAPGNDRFERCGLMADTNVLVTGGPGFIGFAARCRVAELGLPGPRDCDIAET